MSGILELARSHQPLADQLASELEEVRRIFERQLASELSAVNRLCMHIESYRGKMLRPTLVLLSGLATSDGRSTDDARRAVAAVAEMIHMATLVHDDVLDEAEVRRRGGTVNHLWGNETAVMLGDYLISNAFHLCSTIGEPWINVELGKVTNTLCEGELIQLRHRDDYGIDEATYLEIIDRKTASLIAACCRLGARLAGASDEVALALERYGRTVGLAFQIHDDQLDLLGRESQVGKSLGKDLEKGKLTLPIILHLGHAAPAQRAAALEAIRLRDTETLRSLLADSGALDATQVRAEGFVRDALTSIDGLAGPTADLLRSIAHASVARAF